MDELEKTALWADIRKVFASGQKPVRYEYKATLHTQLEDFPVYKIISMDNVRDYVNNVGDITHIELFMPLGEYVKRLYPHRANLELTINRRLLGEVGEVSQQGHPDEEERFKAIFLVNENRNIRGSEFDSIDKQSLDLMDVVTVKLQLMNRAMEPLRIKTTGGAFKNITCATLIKAVLGGESLKIEVDGKPAIDGLDMVPPNNTETRKHITIEHNTPVTTVPTLMQESHGGVYNAGIGNYLQSYRGKLLWFVYPLFNVERFGELVPKAVFYAVPRTRYPNIERTYREEADIVHILATSQKAYKDSGDADLMDQGSGFRMADSRAFMKKPVKMTAEGPVGVRNRLNHEVVGQSRDDGLNYAPRAARGISCNPFAEASRVLQRAGSRIDLTWEHAEPSMLYPGMPCKYIFLEKNVVKHVQGVVLFSHVLVQMSGQGIASKSHHTSCQITLFVSSIEEEGS